jgi:hypothetical protein
MSSKRICAPFWSGTIPAVLLVCLLLSGPARSTAATPAAAPCTLAWDASPDKTVAGYAVYYGLAGSTTTNRLDAGKAQTATVYNLTISSNYFFYVVAYDTNSVYSNPSQLIYYRPTALSALHLIAQADGTVALRFLAAPGAVCSVQYTASLLNPQWQTLGSATADATGSITIVDPLVSRVPARFYRAVR